ncbi:MULTISPECIES: hypothetical protein [Rhodomicrobium]|uniref:hypothetical protein n=1 Tax=Rhodomicrobium TaxID=1068 RepID=UPI000B4AFBCA|nr:MULTISPECIES: hypothetical protein [Rhodomicrobium]
MFAIVLTSSSYFASKHHTLNPCTAAARAVKADCGKFLSSEGCSILPALSEETYAKYLADENTYAGCYLIMVQNEFK